MPRKTSQVLDDFFANEPQAQNKDLLIHRYRHRAEHAELELHKAKEEIKDLENLVRELSQGKKKLDTKKRKR